MIIYFPKKLQNNQKGYKFLIHIYSRIINDDARNITLNLQQTRIFDTNLLAIIDLIEHDCKVEGKKLTIIMPDGKISNKEHFSNDLFDIFSFSKSAFFKPRCIVGNSNMREVEDILIKYLKSLNLQEYDKIKIIISELKTNIQMHIADEKCVGYIAAHHNKQQNTIIISIANNIRSLKNNLLLKKLSFENEEDAIKWCLKKRNSTRQEDESGGLGLYLLRKYLSQIHGNMNIISGNAYMAIGNQLYNQSNENDFSIDQTVIYEEELAGTIFTIVIPYRIYQQKVIEEKNEEIDLINILEKMDGMY